MKLFFDLDSDRIVQFQGSKTPLPQAEHKRGSGSGITLVLLRDGASWQAGSLAQMVACVKPRGKYAPEETLAFAETWSFDPARVEYVGGINYITERLDEILQISGALPNHSTSINDLVLEVAYRPSDSSQWTHRSQSVPFVLHNNYYRGSETVPPAAPSEEGSILPAGVWQVKALAAAVPTLSTSLVDVTGLSFPVQAGKSYRFRFFIPYVTASDATGCAWTISGPATSLLRYRAEYNVTATTSTQSWRTAYNSPTAANGGSVAAGSLAVIEGTLTAAADGEVVARFRTSSGSLGVTAQAKSSVEWMILPEAP